MKPRRTHRSNAIFSLIGGNEDSDLWAEQIVDHDHSVICSVWQPNEEERRKITNGANVKLIVVGTQHPAVAMHVTTEPLGKNPNA